MRRLITVLVIVLAILVTGAYFNERFFQCRLTVTNWSGYDIDEVTAIVSNGPSVYLGTIENGKTRTARLRPRGESGLTISFLGADGGTVRGGGDYLEPSGYHAHWFIGPGYKVLMRTAEIDELQQSRRSQR